MFCYMVAQNLNCVLCELALWAKLSKEHPTFLLTVADLSQIAVSPEQEEQLVRLHHSFQQAEQAAADLEYQLAAGQQERVYRELLPVLQGFLRDDLRFAQILEKLLEESHAGQTIWLLLVKHIRDEQIYLYRLFHTLLCQLY